MRDPRKEKIWYLVESSITWAGKPIVPTYHIKSEVAVRHDLNPNERVINEEPLTMAEAQAFEKLLPKQY